MMALTLCGSRAPVPIPPHLSMRRNSGPLSIFEKASQARRASTGRPITSALARVGGRAPGAAKAQGEDGRHRPLWRRRIGGNRLALFDAQLCDFATPAPARAEGEQQQGAIAKVSFFPIAMKLTRRAATFRKSKPPASVSTSSKVISIRTSAR